VRANTYAWFREEKYLTETAGWKVQYPEGAMVDVAAPPFSYRYVVGIENQAKQRLDSQSDVFDMVAQAIFLETGTAIAEEQSSSDAIAHVLTDEFMNVQRSFSSLAAASLIYPKQRLLDYCANRFGSTLLTDGLVGVSDAQQVKVDTATLLSNLHLGDAELMGDLLSGLMIRLVREQTIVKADTVATALTQMEAQENENRVAREEARRTLDKTGDKHLAELKARLGQEIAHIAATKGLATAQAVLEMLTAPSVDNIPEAGVLSFDGLKMRLANQSADDNDLKEALKDYKNSLASVDRLDNGPEDKVERLISPNGWKKKFSQAKLNMLNKNKHISELTLELTAQNKGMDIYNQLSALCGNYKIDLSGCTSAAKAAAAELDEIYKNLSDSVANNRSVFEFNQEIKVDFGDYYKRHSSQANAAASFSGMLPSEVGSDLDGLKGWIDQKAKSAAVEYGRHYFAEALESTSLLSTLKEMAEKAGIEPRALIETHLDRLVKYCHPFWKYEENRGLSAADGISIIGIEDENSPLIPDSYKKNNMYHIKTTGFRDRIDLLRTAHGMPAFLLKGMEDYRVNYEKLRKGWDPLHILNDMDLASDLVPEQDQAGQEMFAIAKAFDYIVQIGSYFYFDPELAYKKDEIKPTAEYRLANGREKAAEAFTHKAEWQTLAENTIDSEVSEMGNKAAIEKLETAVKNLKKMIAAATPGEESIRKQLEKEVKALQAFQRKLGKIG
jgi:hypothetical protein